MHFGIISNPDSTPVSLHNYAQETLRQAVMYSRRGNNLWCAFPTRREKSIRSAQYFISKSSARSKRKNVHLHYIAMLSASPSCSSFSTTSTTCNNNVLRVVNQRCVIPLKNKRRTFQRLFHAINIRFSGVNHRLLSLLV